MKKSLLFLLPAFLLLAGCVVQGGKEIKGTDTAGSIAAGYSVALEDAIEEMYSLMEAIEPGTRSSRTVKFVDLIGGGDLGGVTRSDSPIMDIDSLLYLVNFDEGGFSVLGADARLASVIALAELGELTKTVFTGGGSTTPTYSLADLWVEEDGDYLLGDVSGEEFIASMLISYAQIAILDPNPPGEYDGTGDNDLTDPTNPSITYTYHYGDWQVNESNTRRRLLNNNIRWRQRKPFNEYCPVIKGDTMPTGCVAIAVMQIAGHHKYPDAGLFGPINYSTSYGNVTQREELTMSWPALTDSAYTTYNVSLQHTAGWIARWIGHQCNMRYNYFGSGQSFATPNRAAKFLREMGYDAVRYTSYTEAKLKSSILSGNPGIIGGISNEKNGTRSDGKSKGGHAWVADGWMARYANHIKRGSDGSETVVGKKTQDLVHCNWGWNGWYDGYYVSNVFKLTSGPTVIGDGDDTSQDTDIDNYDFMMRTVIIKR